MTEDQSLAQLAKCTLKKSYSTISKLLLVGLYAIGIIGLFIVLYSIFDFIVHLINFSGIVLWLYSIPWYMDILVLAITTIISYSLIWCLWNELTYNEQRVTNQSTLYGLLGGIIGIILFFLLSLYCGGGIRLIFALLMIYGYIVGIIDALYICAMYYRHKELNGIHVV